MFHLLSGVLSRRFWFAAVGVASLVYGLAILLYVPFIPDLGLPSAFGTSLKGNPTIFAFGEAEEILPRTGDRVVQVGDRPIQTWRDLLSAPFEIAKTRLGPDSSGSMKWIEEPGSEHGSDPLSLQELAKLQPAMPDAAKSLLLVRVQFERKSPEHTEAFSAWCKLGHLHFEELFPSYLWFFLKGLLFLVGALVFWKRPNDAAAAQFYLLCVVTLGAYMGGYHWSHIATEPLLILVFMVCAVLLPAVSLHFYLIFPRRKSWFERYPRRTLLAIYGLPGCILAVLVGVYAYVRWFATGEAIPAGLERLRELIYVDFAVSATWYFGCICALLHSRWTITGGTERNQVRCILWGLVVASIPLSWSLYLVIWEPDRFVEGDATWPMFLASACITVAFAVSISRYRLMEIDKVINSSMAYFLVSCVAGLTYYGVLFLGALLFRGVSASPDLTTALTASTTALLLLLALNLARGRFMKALDRRFSRNKSQLDRTLQQMSAAVAQLVDPPVLAQQLLQATTELLGVAQGAIYLRQGEPPLFRLSAVVGAAPPLEELSPGFPLIEAVQTGCALLPPDRFAQPAPSLAQRQLLFLGGAIAQPLTHNGRLLAVLILGPKDTPYRADDCHLLASFAQITVLALGSAAGHHTIEELNRDLQTKVDKIAEQQRRILVLQTQLHHQNGPDAAPAAVEAPAPLPALPGGIIGSSPVVRQLHGLVRKVAVTDAVVLILGESGTGKELLARAVHETSSRAGKPYVKVHCAALSANLLESELFGHVKGAFTGAHRDKVGRFELANGGTLFLDEIGDVSLEVQTKLLRVLQEKTLERVGSSDPLHVDVRIITATHQNLPGLIKQGRFREDLYYRLNVFPIQVPPLRARAEDVPELVVHFMRQSALRCGKPPMAIDDEALAALKAFAWPGNIRQLENVIERAVVIAEGTMLTLHELPEEVHAADAPVVRESRREPARPLVAVEAHSNGTSLRSERERFEREQLLQALRAAVGNKAEAARALGIARSTLVSRLKKLGLS
jgi:transcriptional regulator with GAF, ATPase, and Fis domain